VLRQWRERRAREQWARRAPAEHVRSGLAAAPAQTLQEIRRLVADDPASVPAESWYEILVAVFGYGEQDLAREVFAVFDRRVGADSPLRRQRDSLAPWVAADADSPTAPPPAGGRRCVAIMDYGHPGVDRASANIGDHIQSIAMLGHLVRHSGLRLHGEPQLVELLGRLAGRTRPELRRDAVQADVEVITVHRDASMYQPIPEDTWVMCFGWYMHALFRLRHGFPLHRNLRPIFVSFHCNKRGLLTPAAIEYLRRHGPVGCRDWTTVYLLLSCDVPAFFSGCVTTTIDAVFPALDAPPPADAPVAYVDMPDDAVPPGAVTYAHSSGAVRRRSFVANVGRALELLETYRSRHSSVVTSRLHCYLPVRSLGVPAQFRPKNRSDIRFDGLLDISDDAFGAIRTGLLDRLEQVHTAILSGRPEDEVYALWRELAAADVSAAEERLRRPLRLSPVPPEIGERVERAVARTVIRGSVADAAVHCAVVLPKGGAGELPALATALSKHASRPLHLWILARAGTGGVDRLARQAAPLSISRVPVRGLGRLVRLALADLLPDVDRLVVLRLDSAAAGDVAALAELDLGGHSWAAPLRSRGASGFGVIHSAAARLGDRDRAAAELRRAAHARHRFDFDAFSGEVLVLDLERMRRERFSSRALPLALEFDLRDIEVLHVLGGPDHATIPERWAAAFSARPGA
jgi:hypothetical protein